MQGERILLRIYVNQNDLLMKFVFFVNYYESSCFLLWMMLEYY